MQRALLALFREPQNNLRLFLGGTEVRLQPGGDLKAASAAVTAAFGPQFATMSPLAAVKALTGEVQSILAKEGGLSCFDTMSRLEAVQALTVATQSILGTEGGLECH